jgi:hypothetical protein
VSCERPPRLRDRVNRALERSSRGVRPAMKIALFDYVVSARSPAGSCDVRVLQALREEHDVTVVTSELAVPGDGDRAVWHVTRRRLDHCPPARDRAR